MTTHSAAIIGAASDIGRAIAAAYAAAGRPVMLVGRNVERLTRFAQDLRLRTQVHVELVELDILDDAAQERLIQNFTELPATVVCVVGLLGSQAHSSVDPIAAELVMRTNFVAPAQFLERIALQMERRGSGTIIGISSVAGDRGRASNYTYGSAKAGFTAFLSGLRNRLVRSNVHVITVKPGFVETKMTEGLSLPRSLTAQPDEVARAVIRAEAKLKNTIYVRGRWLPIMLIIRLIPERVFKRMRL